MKKVIVGLSGGVDSSVTAALLKRDGYDVTGVSLRLWRDSGTQDNDARSVADSLGINYAEADCEKDFKSLVVDYFVNEYLHGRTPNPCVVCNKKLKLRALLRAADSMGADYIATGHYARTEHTENGVLLKRASYIKKDQSYFLYDMEHDILERLILPLGIYSKDEVRQIAADLGIRVAKKPDSQEICFLPDGDYVSFIEKYATSLPPRGDMLFEDGIKIGKHEGIYRYTIGQRKGLGSFGKPVFVRNIDARNNTVTIGDDLYTNVVFTENFTNTCSLPVSFPIEVTVKIRSRAKEAPAVAEPFGNGLKIIFSEPQRAVTPGQSAVLYKDDVVVGGGIIKSTEGDCHEI